MLCLKQTSLASIFVYYLPHEELKGPQSVLGPKGRYRKDQQRGEASWGKSYGSLPERALQTLLKARVHRVPGKNCC